jgi:hypothetical protein
MKKSAKISAIAIGIILIVTISTNPSNKNFAEYLHAKGVIMSENTHYSEYRYGKYRNYLIFSIFHYNCGEPQKRKGPFGYHTNYGKYCERYIGIFKNFYRIKS